MNNEKKLALHKQQLEEIEELRSKVAQDKLRAYEDKILYDCFQIVNPVLNFYKLNPEDPTTVPQSIEKLSIQEQAEWMRLARTGWASNKDAPIGVKLAFQTMQGIINARAKQQEEGRVLNIQTATFVNPTPKFDVVEVDEDSNK